MKNRIAVVVGASLLLAVGPLGASPVNAAPEPEQNVETANRLTPLPGCASAGSNIGAVTSLTATRTSAGLRLTWAAPRTRAPWVISGYNVYKLNPASGVMEIIWVTSTRDVTLPAATFQTTREGSVPLQVAAYGFNPRVQSSATEGCRSARVFSGRINIPNAQRVPITSGKQLSCATLGNHVVIAVSGVLKANAQVIKPAAFGLALNLSPARFARPLSRLALRELREAISVYASETVGPGYQLTTRTIECFRR
jgi:hypothetical protein